MCYASSVRSQGSEHIGQVFGIDLSGERFSSADRVADTEIGGVRKSKGGIGDTSPITSHCG